MKPRQLFNRIQRLLPAFEASARLGSFTRAAAEIGLTQSAVSKQIQELEDKLGQPLFSRSHRRIDLTPTGSKLFQAYAFATTHVIDVLDDMVSDAGLSHVVLSTSTANASFMLLPHVARMRACFPGREIFVVTSDPQGIEPTGRIDLAFVFGEPGFGAFESRSLFHDILTPVCSPAYLQQRGPLQSVDQLLTCDLLDMKAQHPTWMGWRRWLRTFELDVPADRPSLSFNNYYNTIQACLAGQGVALGWLRMLGSLIGEGRLITPLSEYVETSSRYHLAWPAQNRPDLDIQPFADWLVSQFGQEIPSFDLSQESTGIL